MSDTTQNPDQLPLRIATMTLGVGAAGSVLAVVAAPGAASLTPTGGIQV